MSPEAKEKPTLYGDASPAESVISHIYAVASLLTVSKRESTAMIKNAPKIYAQASPPQRQNIIEIDCRGLEFIEFKSDVCSASGGDGSLC